MYTKEDCIRDTTKHIEQVRENLICIIERLKNHAQHHDESKLCAPEIDGFIEFTPKLRTATYGSEEYQTYLQELKPFLNHHYQICMDTLNAILYSLNWMILYLYL